MLSWHRKRTHAGVTLDPRLNIGRFPLGAHAMPDTAEISVPLTLDRREEGVHD
ncbi:MAG: hypothetical protein ABIZ57_11425 [Candidatus Limnocylindria bacterium]